MDSERHGDAGAGRLNGLLQSVMKAMVMPFSATALGAALALMPSTGLAQVRFDDCQPVAGGGITCNTVPYGNTRADMIDGQYGLLDQASPGWAEYNPYEGYDDMLGGNQT